MERKSAIAIAVGGNPIPPPDLQNAWNVQMTPDRQYILFDSAEQALQFMVKHQNGFRRMSMKEILTKTNGKQPTADWSNLFEKDLQDLFPGAVLVSTEIARLYSRQFVFERVQDEEGDLYFLNGAKSNTQTPSNIQISLNPLVGRQNELKRLEEWVEQVQEDQGQIVSIIGDAGMGKTRLVAEFKKLLQEKPVQLIEGTCPADATHPYEVFRKVIFSMIGISAYTFTRWKITGSDADFLRLFLYPGEQIDRLTSMSEEEIKQGLFSSIRKLFQRVITTPHVIILEDLHWAHPLSIELMKYILEGLEELKLLLVLVHRPELEITWDRRLNYNEVRLSPLNSDEIGQIAKYLLKAEDVSLKLRNSLEKHTRGNPLFAEELLRHLYEAKKIHLEKDPNGKQVVRAEDETLETVPHNIHNVISSRIRLLSNSAQEVLQWASLFGAQFGTNHFESFLDQHSIQNWKEAAHSLFQRNYLSEKSAFPQRIHQFSHDLIYEVVLSSIAENQKAERHFQIAEFLAKKSTEATTIQMDEIAQHYLLGTPNKSSIEYMVQTANALTNAYQFSRAQTLLEGAKHHWENEKSDHSLLDQIMVSYLDLSQNIGDLQKTKELLELWKNKSIDSSHIHVLFPYYQSKYYIQFADYETALQWMNKALPQLQSSDRKKEYYDAMSSKIFILNLIGKNKDALSVIHQTLDELENDPTYLNERLQVWIRGSNVFTSLDQTENAFDFLKKAEKQITEKTPIHLQLELLRRSIQPLARAGKHKEAIQKCTRLIELAREYGFKQYSARAYMDRAIETLEDGNYVSAFPDYEAAVLESDSIHDESTFVRSISGIIDGLVDIGVIHEAQTLWKKYHQRMLKISNNWHLGAIHSIHAGLLELLQTYRESAEKFEISIELYQKVGHKPAVGRAYMYQLRINALYDLQPIEKITKEFNQFAKEELKTNRKDNHYQIQATAMFLACKGGKPKVGLDLNLNPNDCPIAWLKQLVFVSKILYLDSLGKKKEANALRKEYEKVRNEIAKRIPKKYHDDFFKHPVYRVPL